MRHHTTQSGACTRTHTLFLSTERITAQHTKRISIMCHQNRMSMSIAFAFVALLIACTSSEAQDGFVATRGSQFVMNGKPIYFNGFNSYWLMYQAADPNPTTRNMTSDTLEQASKYGMNVARTWAFSDGGYRPLQITPGSYNEDMFKGLDFVISEAQKNGVYLILSLVNNWDGFGGKKQYVQWARDAGIYLNNDDDFFTDPTVKGYYKNHIKAVLTRVNSITGVSYKDDATILAWELINEPRCQSDLSGKTIQDWVEEMSFYVKSVDNVHLLTIGLEGFYGESMPDRKQNNPGYQVGTDFISNHRVPVVDFTTIHIYPDQWIYGSSDATQESFMEQWIQVHAEDSKDILGKPMLVTEFGKSSRSSGYTVELRDAYLGEVFNQVYGDAQSGGSCGGALFWQVMAQGMEAWSDGYEVVLQDSPSTGYVVYQQSTKIQSLNQAAVAHKAEM